MKNKGAKITLIIILVILVIALINFMIYAMVNKNGEFKLSLIGFGDNTAMIFEKEYNPEELNNINVDVSSSNVKIEKADIDKIKITAYGEKEDKIKEVMNENELSITKENTKIFIFTMLYWCREEIIIQVPNNCDEEFNIKTSSGDIIVPDLEGDNIELKTASGKIQCGNINNGNIETSSGDILIGNGNEVTLKASSGNIKAGDFNKLSAEASSGYIEIGTISEDAKVKTASGKITLNGANKLKAEAISGDIKINSIENNCEISSTSGNIIVDRANINENSFIKTNSGNVVINNKNDIYVETETTSGDADVQNNNRMSEIVLDITTTSGNIKVN